MYNYLDGYAVFTDEKLFSHHDFYRRDKITPFPIFLILCGRNVNPSLLIPPCEAPIQFPIWQARAPRGREVERSETNYVWWKGFFFTLLVVVSYGADLSCASMPYSFLLLFIFSLSSVKSARSPFSEVTRAIRRSQIQQQMPGLV